MRRESNHAFLFFLILTSQFVGNHNLKKLTNNLRLRILDAFSIIYYPEKWCERKETFRQLISNIKHVKIVNLQNHVQLRLSLRLL